MSGLFIVCGMLTGAGAAQAKPLALIYRGDGACWPCINGAAKMADLSGFEVQMVDQTLADYSVFQRAKLWIQPGGQSVKAARTMGPRLMEAVRRFVADGGGYVGFCAGAFLSNSLIGTSGRPGLGIVPGSASYHIEEDDQAYRTERVWTPEGARTIFFAGGPQFHITEEELRTAQGRVTARTESGQIVAVEVQYGRGKVAISGFHPEASILWKRSRLLVSGGYLRAGAHILGLGISAAEAVLLGPLGGYLLWRSPYFDVDQDGDDYQIARGMIHYATSP